MLALTNGIIFEFVEDTTNTRFVNSTSSGLIMTSLGETQANTARWGKVLATGPLVDEVVVGDFILIEAGMWTPSVEDLETGSRCWKTDIDKVLAVSPEPYSTY